MVHTIYRIVPYSDIMLKLQLAENLILSFSVTKVCVQLNVSIQTVKQSLTE